MTVVDLEKRINAILTVCHKCRTSQMGARRGFPRLLQVGLGAALLGAAAISSSLPAKAITNVQYSISGSFDISSGQTCAQTATGSFSGSYNIQYDENDANPLDTVVGVGNSNSLTVTQTAGPTCNLPPDNDILNATYGPNFIVDVGLQRILFYDSADLSAPSFAFLLDTAINPLIPGNSVSIINSNNTGICNDFGPNAPTSTNSNSNGWCANQGDNFAKLRIISGTTQIVPSPFSAFAIVPLMSLVALRRRFRKL